MAYIYLCLNYPKIALGVELLSEPKGGGTGSEPEQEYYHNVCSRVWFCDCYSADFESESGECARDYGSVCSGFGRVCGDWESEYS